MIQLEHVETFGWEAALRGMRNPLDSWDRADSRFGVEEYFADTPEAPVFEWTEPVVLGARDEDLMRRLISQGTSDHCKFRRMIGIGVDVTAPLYWWKEADTYKVGTTANSCSTMHTIMSREFTRDMFSWEDVECDAATILLDELNHLRKCYTNAQIAKDGEAAKHFWRVLIQLLPSAWNQKRTWMLNYEVMSNIYHARRHHKLREWRDFIDVMVGELPYPWIFTGEGC